MTRTKWKGWAIGALPFIGAFVINPALLSGCEPSFEYGEREMIAVLDSVNQAGRFTFEHKGTRHELTLSLDQIEGADKTSALDASLTRAAHACSQRTFMRSAAACSDETTIPVKGKLTLTRIAMKTDVLLDAVEFEGNLMAIGTSLGRVQLALKSGDRYVSLHSSDAKTFTLRRVNLGDASDVRYSAD